MVKFPKGRHTVHLVAACGRHLNYSDQTRRKKKYGGNAVSSVELAPCGPVQSAYLRGVANLGRRRRGGLDGADSDGRGGRAGGRARRLAVAVVPESGEDGQTPA